MRVLPELCGQAGSRLRGVSTFESNAHIEASPDSNPLLKMAKRLLDVRPSGYDAQMLLGSMRSCFFPYLGSFSLTRHGDIRVVLDAETTERLV